MTGALLWIETQEGKENMRKKPYQELGSTAACVLRGVMSSCKYMQLLQDNTVGDEDLPPSPKLYLGDSWFGSVNALVALSKPGHHGIFIVKTSHSRTPKKFLEETMQTFPGGTWITLTAELDGVKLISIGYKYNKKTVLTFLATQGAGTTIEGDPYEARFPDQYGNLCVRHVSRPQIISDYFKYSNVVDLHNQARQSHLGLEKKWITHDGYFRLYCTLVGMIVTDIWKIFKIGSTYLSKMPITHFADLLAADMIAYADTLSDDCQVTPALSITVTESSCSLSTLTTPKDMSNCSHTKILNPSKQSRCIWCSRVHLIERKTTLKCMECNSGFCRATTGRNCWENHVSMGSVPVAPKRGKRKRMVEDIETATV